MARFSDDELIQFVLGESPPDKAAAIRTTLETDRELAATIDLLSCVKPAAFEGTANPVPSKRSHPGMKKLAFALIGCLLLGGISWAGWIVLSPKALLEDDFDSNWGDARKWTSPRRSVFVQDGHVRLFDRGYLVTAEQFDGPIELTFRWKWIDLAGDLNYRDVLTVALRTSGIPKETFNYEATDGVGVNFMAHAGDVSCFDLGRLEEEQNRRGIGSIPMPSDTWRYIRITDDGETISAYIANNMAALRRQLKPIISFRALRPASHRFIAFYNRERLASASHESWIDDIVIRRLETDK